MKDRVRTRCIQ